MIQATDAAIKEIKKALEHYKDEMNEQFIRLSMAVGWGGPRLDLALEESAGNNDEVVTIEDVKFLIHKNATPYFQNTKLDYVRGLFGQGEFKILTV